MIMLWSINIYLVSHMFRGPTYDVGRRRYLVLGLWFGGPLLSILSAGLLLSTFGKSKLLFALSMIPLAVGWLLGILLPRRWRLSDRRQANGANLYRDPDHRRKESREEGLHGPDRTC